LSSRQAKQEFNEDAQKSFAALLTKNIVFYTTRRSTKGLAPKDIFFVAAHQYHSGDLAFQTYVRFGRIALPYDPREGKCFIPLPTEEGHRLYQPLSRYNSPELHAVGLHELALARELHIPVTPRHVRSAESAREEFRVALDLATTPWGHNVRLRHPNRDKLVTPHDMVRCFVEADAAANRRESLPECGGIRPQRDRTRDEVHVRRRDPRRFMRGRSPY
jgi:hypothetical protein